MNREQMVEKAARVLCDSQNPGVERAWSAYREDWLRDAAEVLDAILPQVTTVAELEKYDPRSAVVETTGTYAGESWRAEQIAGFTDEPGWPLTVVWQPEATS